MSNGRKTKFAKDAFTAAVATTRALFSAEIKESIVVAQQFTGYIDVTLKAVNDKNHYQYTTPSNIAYPQPEKIGKRASILNKIREISDKSQSEYKNPAERLKVLKIKKMLQLD